MVVTIAGEQDARIILIEDPDRRISRYTRPIGDDAALEAIEATFPFIPRGRPRAEPTPPTGDTPEAFDD
ncbi:MAG TPA: hypothetical protein VFW86_02490 [Candidatus Limnocylindrales bacterium]|nr:hypothetical protein [Candidatus Limnocylindrales bacterium]